ncbi:30S ribosomal protein S20 [Thermodesulfobacteriota bacterium]
MRRLRNRAVKTRIKSVVKSIRSAAAGKTTETAEQGAVITLDAAKSIIDRAAKQGVIHKKTAMRKVSRLARLTNAETA